MLETVERLITNGRIYVCNGKRAAQVIEMCREGDVPVLVRRDMATGGWWISVE